MLGMILQKCSERFNSSAMWRFILRFVVHDVSKDCSVFIFKEKIPLKLKIKTVRSCKLQPLHSLQYTASCFKRHFLLLLFKQFLLLLPLPLLYQHILLLEHFLYLRHLLFLVVLLYSIFIGFSSTFWLKRKSSIFATASVLLAVEEASSDSLPLDKTIYFAEYQTPFQLGYNNQNMNLVVPSSDFLQTQLYLHSLLRLRGSVSG
jgi:hypothetical protein